MKRLLFTLLAALTLPLTAQDEADENQVQMAAWLMEFSNLRAEVRTEFARHFQYAKDAYAADRWVECLGHLNSCELIFDGNPHVWSLKAGCEMEQGHYAEAKEYAAKALEHMPNDLAAMLYVSYAQMGLGEYAQSREILEQVLTIIPAETSRELSDIICYRAFLCELMQGKQEEALELVDHASEMDDTPLYFYVQAAQLIKEGKNDEAQNEINIAKKIFKDSKSVRSYFRALEVSGILSKFKK